MTMLLKMVEKSKNKGCLEDRRAVFVWIAILRNCGVIFNSVTVRTLNSHQWWAFVCRQDQMHNGWRRVCAVQSTSIFEHALTGSSNERKNEFHLNFPRGTIADRHANAKSLTCEWKFSLFFLTCCCCCSIAAHARPVDALHRWCEHLLFCPKIITTFSSTQQLFTRSSHSYRTVSIVRRIGGKTSTTIGSNNT